MAYQIATTKQFDKDVDRLKKRGYDLELLKRAINLLATGKPMPEQYLDHPLKGDKRDCRECHISFDWLILYRKDKNRLILLLQRTGTHSVILK